MTTNFKEFFHQLKESTFCDADTLQGVNLSPEEFFWLMSQCIKSGENLNVFLHLLKSYPINIENMGFYEKLLIQSVTLCSDKNENQYKCLDLLIKGSKEYIHLFKDGKLLDYLYFEHFIDMRVLALFKDCGSKFLQVKNEYCLCYMAHSNKSIESLTLWINVVGLPESEHYLFFKRFIKYIFITEIKANNLALIPFLNLLVENNWLPSNLHDMITVLIDLAPEIKEINPTLFLYCLEILFKNADRNTLQNTDTGYKLLLTHNQLLINALGRYDMNWLKEDITGENGFNLLNCKDLIKLMTEFNPLVLNLLKKESIPELESVLGESLISSCAEITEDFKSYINSQIAYNLCLEPPKLYENYFNFNDDKDLTIIKKIINNSSDYITFLFSEFCMKNNVRINEEKLTKDKLYSDVALSIHKELNTLACQTYVPLSSSFIKSFMAYAGDETQYLLSFYEPKTKDLCKDLDLLVPMYTEEESIDTRVNLDHWEDGNALLKKYKIEIAPDEIVSYETFNKMYKDNIIDYAEYMVVFKLFSRHLATKELSKAVIDEPKVDVLPEVKEDDSFISQELFSQKDKDDFISENKTEEERKEIKKLVLQLDKVENSSKKLLAKSTNLFSQIESLYYNFPHFEKVIQHLENHCHLQKAGNGVFYIPPLLFAGGPGVGKTFFAHQLSMFVKTNFHMFNMESMTAGWILMGLNGSWGGSATGKVYDVLMKKEMMNPIFLLDEIDKCPKGSYSAENALLSLLEQYTAKNFRDECVPLPIDASNIIWFATANNLQNISAPIKSRFDIFHIPNPNTQQKKALINNIYRSILSSNSWGVNFSGNLPNATLDALSQTMTPGAARDLRKIITTGCSKAIRANRDELRIEDLEKFEQPHKMPWDLPMIETTYE